jgi:hypothetical protein
MSTSILRLKLDFSEYYNPPECPLPTCGREYKVFQRFYKVLPDGEGGLVFLFASPEHGFAKAEPRPLPKERFEQLDLPKKLEDLLDEEWDIVFPLVFADKDVGVTWRRLRSLLTCRYKHPEGGENKPCPNELKNGDRFITKGPPKTIFLWAEPLFVALYGLGLSYREIVAELNLASPEQTGVCNSVGRRIKHYREETQDVKLELLHQLNRRKYTCSWHYASEPGMVWEIAVEETLDPLTSSWLEKLAEHYNAFQSYAFGGVSR